MKKAELTTAAVGVILCAVLSIKAAAVMLVTVIVMLTMRHISEKKRGERILHLCDEIDKILHGAETVDFDDFKEGELSILSSEIHKMTIRLREQNSALKGEKAAMKIALEDMSHQLRTPLTSVMLLLEMLRDPNLPQNERLKHIREMTSLLSQMQWILETLLNISRMEAGAVTFLKQDISAAKLISDAAEPIAISLELKGITLKTEIEGDPHFTADLRYCTEALTNILKNCMEHTPEGGMITVLAYENPLYSGITVTDTGGGFPEEMLPHIFERFCHDNQKNGFGIGLAFARSVVVSQNGSLQARNSPEGGAEFDWRFFYEPHN
ncbi:MAG: HAMP domain-containing histidine kinase [Oscillospiraceae bacterium]|nr:HAMP domain-containing histidine kinase [Oscillospiraceae bacterium]